MISVIIPAHNEERLLPNTVRTVRAALRSLDIAHEIIVVNDASADATHDTAVGIADRVIDVDLHQIAAARNAERPRPTATCCCSSMPIR